MRTLAKRLRRDELACDALAGRQLRASDAQRDGGVALERAAADLLEPPAMLVGPRNVLSGKKAASAP